MRADGRRLDHVGIVVGSLVDAARIYTKLGFTVEKIVRFQRDNGKSIQVGIMQVAPGVVLEFLEDPEMLHAGAPPLNHVCFEVPDVASELARLRKAGVPLEDARPRRGVIAENIAFLEASAADGVRIELAQK